MVARSQLKSIDLVAVKVVESEPREVGFDLNCSPNAKDDDTKATCRQQLWGIMALTF